MTLLSRSAIVAGAACLAACSSVAPKPPAEAPKVATEASRQDVPPPVDSKRAEQAAPASPKAAPSQATAKPKAPTPPKSAEASALAKAPAPAPATTAAKAPVAESAPKPAPLNLKTLEQRLKDTNAIGVLTKLSLKNQVDDLLGHFRAYHDGKRPPTLTELRPSFELLLMKVLSLLQDKDVGLARDINASRDAIWGVLADKQKFAEFS